MKRVIAILCLVALLFVRGVTRVEQQEQYTLYLPIVIGSPVQNQGAGATYADCGRIDSAGLMWHYDWSRNPPDCGEAVPMIWGKNDVGKPIGGDSEWLLGFNEPEMEWQANITPTLGAELWREVEQAYPDKQLVSPSASLCWLTEWWDAYVTMYGEPPRVDAVGSHCYGAWTAGTAFARCKQSAISTVAWAQAHDIGAVWITEFAHLPCWSEGDQGVIQFMQAMVAYYRETPEITRWAWFQNSYHGDEPWAFGSHCNTSLVDIDTGELTVFGEAYKALAEGWP